MNNNKYPHKIRKLCGSKSIMKNTISQLPMEYIKSEEEDNSVLTAKIAESIKSRGMLSPIVVYKESKNTFKIIDGRRRYLAAEMLQREYIECLILSCGEETGKAMCLANKLSKLCADRSNIAAFNYPACLSCADHNLILEIYPEIETSYVIDFLPLIGSIENDELKLLKKIDLLDTLYKILKIKDKNQRLLAEEAAVDMLGDCKALIDKTISEALIKPQKNKKLVIKDTVFLFNSLDAFVNKLSNDKLDITVTKDFEPDVCEYKLSISHK